MTELMFRPVGFGYGYGYGDGNGFGTCSPHRMRRAK